MSYVENDPIVRVPLNEFLPVADNGCLIDLLVVRVADNAVWWAVTVDGTSEYEGTKYMWKYYSASSPRAERLAFADQMFAWLDRHEVVVEDNIVDSLAGGAL